MTSKRKTQKKGQKKTLMTIPQLRSAFEHLDQKALSLKGKDKDMQIQEFQAAWKAVFSRDVSPKAVEAYLAVKHAERGASKKRSTRRKSRRGANQSGGAAMPLAGAPFNDFQTRPGIDGVSGSFPAYVDKGLSFYDTINQHARMADCGVKDFSPKVGGNMGSNQAGGGTVITDFASALTFKPFESTVPSSVYQDARSAYLGAPLPPSPSVEDHTWKFK